MIYLLQYMYIKYIYIYMSYIITVYIYILIYIYSDVWYAGSAGCGMHDLALTCTSFVMFHGHRVNLSAGLDSLPARTVELGDLNGT